ncbi:MAG: Eco57I restriction-modification methylase domain-containing protein [Gemmataceae bacterium]
MRFPPDGEERRLREQARLDRDRTTAERNRSGQFATPSLLAEEILRFCWQRWQQRPRPVSFLEPCLGTGAFYSALLRVFPNDRIERAVGYEIDADYAETAKRLWHASGLAVTPGDFLQQPPPRNKYNLLITNPPYVRHHHLERARKERLQHLVRERLGIRISGLAGLYCYFLLLADVWLEQGGLSVWLVPAEFLDVNYGVAIKEYLTTKVRLLHLHRFCPSDVQFDDALVSSAIVVFEKAKPTGQEVVFTLGGSLLKPAQSVLIPHESLRAGEKWSPYTASSSLGTSRTVQDIRFGDLFRIHRGLATGNNSFFILPRAEARRLRLPVEFLRPILPAPRQLSERVIEANPDGFPKLASQFALLDCRLPESEVKKRHPDLWRYLECGKRNGIHEGYLTSRRSPWYSQENRPAPPFLCTYMGRQGNGRKPFRFLWNKSRATAQNVYLLLYPKGVLQEVTTRDPNLHAAVFAALQSLDTGIITDHGRVYGGGLYKLEPKELANIPAGFLVERLGLACPRKAFRQRDLFEVPEVSKPPSF